MNVKKLLNTLLVEINNRPFSLAFSCWRKYVECSKKYEKLEYMYGSWYRRDRKSKEPIYFVFRFELPGTGIGSAANTMLFCYDWALKNKVIPIIDLEGPEVFQKGEIGIQNVWEYCFEQALPIKEVVKKDNIYISNIGHILADKKRCMELNKKNTDVSIHFSTEKDYYKKMNIVGKEYLKLKPSLQQKVDEYIINNLKGKKTLGVALREEFSLFSKEEQKDDFEFYNNHVRIPSVEETIEIVDRYFEEWRCEQIFVSSMYEESIEKFREKFGCKIIFLPRKRRKLSGEKEFVKKVWSGSGHNEFTQNYFKTEEFIERTRTYIEEIFILASCDNFIGAPSSVSSLAAIINGGKYNNIDFLNDTNNIASIIRK